MNGYQLSFDCIDLQLGEIGGFRMEAMLGKQRNTEKKMKFPGKNYSGQIMLEVFANTGYLFLLANLLPCYFELNAVYFVIIYPVEKNYRI